MGTEGAAATEAERLNTEGRIASLEGGYEHLATKADLERLKFTLLSAITGLLIVAVGVILAVIRLWLV